jgi:hypothetical protein
VDAGSHHRIRCHSSSWFENWRQNRSHRLRGTSPRLFLSYGLRVTLSFVVFTINILKWAWWCNVRVILGEEERPSRERYLDSILKTTWYLGENRDRTLSLLEFTYFGTGTTPKQETRLGRASPGETVDPVIRTLLPIDTIMEATTMMEVEPGNCLSLHLTLIVPIPSFFYVLFLFLLRTLS